ncbi:MAG TPA: TetR/AcrR family transcriptional regulator [Ideonella sp.]|uniref:TetR/AcrR family transcriptional regulator n=1 Tax=Ideonella sp. TaxID=1929293 RepID=UPI002B773049|nr:TetR/AcrR family transcriptional regulator [Ideonella sp.]HSI50434.1 TetR/AcrR family transcriptional regulator [Ideonella sp.]
MSEPSQRQRRKDARPQELLDAALALFVEKGFAATRSDEVAQRAGVSKGTLYLYFPSKEDLLKAVIQQTLATEIAEGERVRQAHTGSCTEMLVDVLAEWWVKIFESPASGVFKLVLTEMRNFPELAQYYAEHVVQPGSAVIARLVQSGIERGEFRPVSIDVAVHSIVMPLIMMCMHKHTLDACGYADLAQSDPRAFIREHLQLLLLGLSRPQEGDLQAAAQARVSEAPPAEIQAEKLPKMKG